MSPASSRQRAASSAHGLPHQRLLTCCPLLAALCILAAGCASPVAPSGGPEDRTPPALESAAPAAGAVNVRADRLVLTFSEAMDETSVAPSLSISPGWATPPEVRTRGHRVEIVFPDSLRANTTYVVGLDTNLKDLHRVALTQPLTLAFATGPQLDRGRIVGRVLDPAAGSAVSGLDIFAYYLPDSAAVSDALALSDALTLPDPTASDPDYRTQTGTDGTFTLDYLRPGPFFVVAVADGNRNRRADAGEAFAAPFDPISRAAEPDSTRSLEPLRYFRTRLDTIPPTPMRVRTRSARRFAVRFDEPILLRDRTDAWTLTDSATSATLPVRQVYADADPQQLVLVTDSLTARPHRLWLARPAAVTDSSGNAARPDTLVFTPSTEPDTLRTRYLGFLPERGGARIAADSAGVLFNEPPDSTTLARVAVTDTLDAPLPLRLATRDGLRYWIVPEGYQPFRIAVRDPDSTYTRTVVPRSADERGELAGVVTADGPVLVEILVGETRTLVPADSTGAFTVAGLPEGETKLRAWVDRNGNGRWDGGRLAPYVPPEPLVFLDAPPSIRPRWETVIDSLAIE